MSQILPNRPVSRDTLASALKRNMARRKAASGQRPVASEEVAGSEAQRSLGGEAPPSSNGNRP